MVQPGRSIRAIRSSATTSARQPPAYELHDEWSFDLGLDFAVYLPYTLDEHAPHRIGIGQFELRYKPLVSFASAKVDRSAALEREGIDPETSPFATLRAQRVALMPLNFGARLNISPRQRLTAYIGPRWDFGNFADPSVDSRVHATTAPLYLEAWFDLDIPITEYKATKRAKVTGQFTLGYVHSRFDGNGINVGAMIGFFGHISSQFAFRIRPCCHSNIAYQIELGANIGQGVSPFVSFGVVLPSIPEIEPRTNKS